MTALRRTALILFAAPLALAVAACGGGGEDGGVPQGDPVAPIAAPAGTSWVDTVQVTDKGGWLLGNPDAPIKLVEYGSLTCPACANFSNTGIAKLRDEYVASGRVSFELRSVPLHGAVDLILTRLLQCAPKEAAHPLAEQVWANLDAVLNPIQANAAGIEQAMNAAPDQRFVAYAEQAGLLDFFAARGISTEQSRACLSDAAAMQTLAEKLQSVTEEDGVNATPTFFLNGQRVNAGDWGSLEPLLQQAGAR